MAVKAKGMEIPPELLDSLLAKVPDEAERARLSENREHLSVGYYLVPNKKKTKLGATRRGGTPDLPSQVSWPESDGGLLPFLLQLDLADCPAREQLGLPPDGRLYFFETPTFKAPRPVWSRAYSPGQMSPAVVHSTAQPEVRQKPEGVPWAAETSLTVSHFGRQKWPEDPAVGLTVEPAFCLRPDASDPTALAALQKVLDKQNRALARRSAGSILIPGSFWEHERRDAYLTASGRANLTRLGRTKSMLPYRQILSGHELATWEAQLEKLLEQQRAHPVAPPVAIDTAMQNSEPFLARAERDAQVLLAATAATAGAASFREQLETSLAQLKERAGEGLSLADWASLASAIYSYSLQDLPKPEKAALAPLADQPRFCYYTTLLQRCTLFSRRDGAGSMFAVEQRARAEEGQPGIRRHGLPSELHGVRDLQDRLWQLVQQEPLPLEQFGQARPQIEGWLRDLESKVEDIPWGNLHHMLNFAARAIAENNAAAQESFQSVDPELTSELLTSLRWWRQGLEHHQSEQTHWQPLLTLKGWSQGGSSLQWDGEETALYVVYCQLPWTEQAAFVTIRHP